MAKEKVRVWEPDYADDCRVPLPDLISELSRVQIENAGHELTFRTEKEDDYDGPATFDVWVERLETDEEEAKRVREQEASRARYLADEAASERARYEALKRKFESQ